ncbi:MAG: amidase [Deltaproteobacteria bacterium]|nr:amidase [Deltaproteobacteria bacterium]
MDAPHLLTIAAAADQIRTRQVSPVELVRSCLQRIDQLEPRLQAWVTIDRERALATAQRCEEEIRRGEYRGPLHGIPLGIKDIFYTAGLRTTAGSPIYADFVPEYDATAVRRLKEAGAIILGKAQTTEFAALAPSPTHNPWNLEHTPGGSSSGSAAAVAAAMCPGALGSQTYGSTIRPAAYCGCVGLKPSYGRISAFGIFALSWSLDHVGLFARTVTDIALLLQALAGDDPQDPACEQVLVPDYRKALTDPKPPRLGLVRDFFLEKATDETRKHTEAVADRLARAGARIEEVRLPASFSGEPEAHFTMMYAEVATSHREAYAQHQERYSPQMQDLIEKGLKVSGIACVETQRHQQRFRHDLDALCRTVDALLTPSAPAPAPHGLTSTGDPSFNGPASFSGLPSLGLPSGVSANGLPFGTQLMSATFTEERLLAVGKWCEAVLDFRQVPPLA